MKIELDFSTAQLAKIIIFVDGFFYTLNPQQKEQALSELLTSDYQCLKAALYIIEELSEFGNDSDKAFAKENASKIPSIINDVKVGDCNQILYALTQLSIADDKLVDEIIKSLIARNTSASYHALVKVLIGASQSLRGEDASQRIWANHAPKAIREMSNFRDSNVAKFSDDGYVAAGSLAKHLPKLTNYIYVFLAKSSRASAANQILDLEHLESVLDLRDEAGNPLYDRRNIDDLTAAFNYSSPIYRNRLKIPHLHAVFDLVARGVTLSEERHAELSRTINNLLDIDTLARAISGNNAEKERLCRLFERADPKELAPNAVAYIDEVSRVLDEDENFWRAVNSLPSYAEFKVA